MAVKLSGTDGTRTGEREVQWDSDIAISESPSFDILINRMTASVNNQSSLDVSA
jgi:hypothetical protein